jgi:hypothetical protein
MPGRASGTVEVDHLIVAGPDLDEAVAYVEGTLGVRAERGGSHPGVGTRNALVGLAPEAYIEVIAPDPGQGTPELPRWFGIDGLRAPRLVTWAARTMELEVHRALARRAGLDLGEVTQGGRVRPDGVVLSWSVTDPRADRFGGVMPFLMDWGESEHPSRALETTCTLASLRAWHPRADAVREASDALELGMRIEHGPEVRLEAEIRTSSGVVMLR